MQDPTPGQRRTPWTRPAVLAAAVAMADRRGIDAVSMRHLAHELGVVPMALYRHVANKEELLDGMVESIIAEIELPPSGADWRSAVRQRIMSARRVLLRHPWASLVIASRAQPTAIVLGYIDSLVATLRNGGLSAELTHQVMHTLGSRMWGFNLEVFPSAPPPEDPATRAQLLAQLAAVYPHIAEIASAGTHSTGTIVGRGCDDQAEFEFGLDVLLDGFAALHARGWRPGQPVSSAGIGSSVD